MITEFLVEEKSYIARAREVFIRMSLLVIVGVSCFLLLRPFLDLIIAGIIIAIGIYPGYQMLTKVLRGRGKLAAVLCTLLLLVAILVPTMLLAGTLADGIGNLADQLKSGQLKIPPPPPSLDRLPIVGMTLKELWNLSSVDISETARQFAPQIRERIPALVSASVGLGGVLLRFLIAILLAGFLLATSAERIRFADRLFGRIFDDQGPEFEQLIARTIRSVTNGILGVALIQSLFASLGFWIVGLPGAGLWAVVFLVASVLQVGGVALVPAVLYAFATQSTSHAVLFLIWCIIVGLMDNVLKPILLGRGSKVPMAVIFLGVLGGFITMRIIGLFVGAIVLSVGYKLLIAWLDTGIPNIDRA
jgi:predicted PurR-regulated permease PerM